jgi:hypothetical protein
MVGKYQFAAMMGLPKGLTLFDFGFILIFGIEDLFFFFWSSRPMIASSEPGKPVDVEVFCLLSTGIEFLQLSIFRGAGENSSR